MTNRDQFDIAKLQLSRLNEEWSPTGQTLSYQAAQHIRQAIWNDSDPASSLRELWRAKIHMIYQYRVQVDPDGNRMQDGDNALLRYNLMCAAASYELDKAQDTLSNAEYEKLWQFIQTETKQMFAQKTNDNLY